MEEAELAETTVMKEEATMEYAEVVQSLEKTSQHDGNLGWSRRGSQVPMMGCKGLILAYPLPAINGTTAPSCRPSPMHLCTHFLALNWAKLTLVHINYRHIPLPDQPRRAGTNANLHPLPSKSLH